MMIWDISYQVLHVILIVYLAMVTQLLGMSVFYVMYSVQSASNFPITVHRVQLLELIKLFFWLIILPVRGIVLLAISKIILHRLVIFVIWSALVVMVRLITVLNVIKHKVMPGILIPVITHVPLEHLSITTTLTVQIAHPIALNALELLTHVRGVK